jgi:MinD superfamily P-loop ATPase
MIRELVVISGKGGTGKTSIAASFAALAKNKVMADCDVDASDLHLVLKPETIQTEPFEGGMKAFINKGLCTLCGKCVRTCRFHAIDDNFTVDQISCEGCGVCARFCPQEAIEMRPHVSGKWFVSDTRHGPLVHARLGIADGNSGKLVTLIKKKAKEIASERGYGLVIVDGSPGTGCPVIATISGASLVLIVTEPTVAGLHDLQRVFDLTRHFRVKAAVCVNKSDINPDKAAETRAFCEQNAVPLLASLPYDIDVTRAQVAGKSIVEFSGGTTSRIVRSMWKGIEKLLH